ncbi:phosphoadenylyl-sulfate reductase [Paenibacillus larvae]|uniref:Adenosine 5'-phosphosulfate reductase n=1 Tax=Paenibacillus larvae subsp. larvae DSM 25430 TaxID=697284 RepID=V9W8Z4_9BACL|nr:phosphoadenylyl-sulfate reductase [Paenibacillus larvae]AHD07506.1 phosphoadenosine phosphosulfate reductase CysH [Paenibacillus larvae subsp. larvae DSM 25430]AVG14068.1 phosphoadenosine phosphosulfate reductase CysH [Paenibacillus larvae subsp. larvae DSM 25430]MDR5567991.1 phosphoadenylyl-sulfate reductase [Paenibacillus larvae]MDR5594004.1 phosphoadenylyl-sulfate reductase [Paenibacillus larvae]
MNLPEKEVLLSQISQEYEQKSAEELVVKAVETFPHITFACSFGAEDVVLVDIMQKVAPSIDIFYLDTHVHFKETYLTKDRLQEKYNIEFIQVEPKISLAEQADRFGEELWKSDPNSCCNIRKVEPLSRILSEYDAWITGIRRDQAPTRANAPKAAYDTKFDLAKFNPLANWTSDDVWDYIREYELIYNPLHDQNYPSIGCEYCTRQVLPGEDLRAGRWSGFGKTECGLYQPQT